MPDTYVDDNTEGKNLLLRVPDYEAFGTRNTDGATWSPGASKKNSFLQMGEASSTSGEGNASNGTDLIADQLSFVDDTRNRGVSGNQGDVYENAAIATPPNEAVVRAAGNFQAYSPASGSNPASGKNLAASAAIPTYVGWRDHTDGHRITTTRGDKIEIVGGNYKLVSLGRGTGTATYEMSGGLALAADEGPGATTSITWRECPTSTASPKGKNWQAVEQVIHGNTVERFHGQKREEFYGSALISVIGSPGEETSGTCLGASVDDESHNGDITYVWDTSTDSLFPTGDAKAARPTKWDASGEALPKLSKPNIYSSTWAQTMSEYTYACDKTELLHLTGKHTVTATYDKSYEATVNLTGFGEAFTEWWKCAGGLGFYEHFEGAMTQFFYGASTTIGFSNRFEFFFGLEQQLNLGGFFELVVGGNAGMTVGAQWELSAGPKLEVETKSLKFWLAKEDTGLSDLETKVSDMVTVINKNTTALSNKSSGLQRSTRHALEQIN